MRNLVGARGGGFHGHIPAGFERGGALYGIPTVVYDGCIYNASGELISCPNSVGLASQRLVLTPQGPKPVIAADFRGGPLRGFPNGWRVGYATRVRVSPAGLATLPDGTTVRVEAPVRVGASPHPRTVVVGQNGDDTTDGSTNTTILGPAGTSQGGGTLGGSLSATQVTSTLDDALTQVENSVSSASQYLVNNLSNAIALVNAMLANPLGFTQTAIQQGVQTLVQTAEAVKNAVDTPINEALSDAINDAETALAPYLPSLSSITTFIIVVLIAVGMWLFWPILAHLRG
jgi:hypothetical protein